MPSRITWSVPKKWWSVISDATRDNSPPNANEVKRCFKLSQIDKQTTIRKCSDSGSTRKSTDPAPIENSWCQGIASHASTRTVMRAMVIWLRSKMNMGTSLRIWTYRIIMMAILIWIIRRRVSWMLLQGNLWIRSIRRRQWLTRRTGSHIRIGSRLSMIMWANCRKVPQAPSTKPPRCLTRGVTTRPCDFDCQLPI